MPLIRWFPEEEPIFVVKIDKWPEIQQDHGYFLSLVPRQNLRRTEYLPLKKVYISVINDLATDQRVHRVAALLQSEGLDVICIGRRLKESPDPKGISCRYRRYRMLFRKGPLFYACFNIRLFFDLLFSAKPALLIANDLDTLPAAFLAGRIRHVPLIYDSHELFTEVPELIERPLVRGIWKRIEKRIVPRLKHAVTVSRSIADHYQGLYGTRFRVVRNLPLRSVPRPDPSVRDQYPGKKIVIYQGALNVGRGLELAVASMQYLDDVILVLAGSGDIEQELRKLVRDTDLRERILFRGRLTPDVLFPITCAADVGISLEEDLGLSYRYALPNKIFDYIQAGVPVLCSALPEMSRIVEHYGVGVVTGERDPEKVATIIRNMCIDRGRDFWREALDRAAGELCWENESAGYLQLLGECGPGLRVSKTNSTS